MDGENVSNRTNPIDIEKGETHINHLIATSIATKTSANDQNNRTNTNDDTNNNTLTQFISVSHELNGRNTFTADHNTPSSVPPFNCNIVHANETTITHTTQQAANVNELTKPAANIVHTTHAPHLLLQQQHSTLANSHTNAKTPITLTPPPPTTSTCSSLPRYIESNSKQKLSNKAVSLLRRSTPIGIVVISCVLAISIAISVCTIMGWDYTVPAIVCGVVAILASSGVWYWLYIAALTAPRDIR